MATQVRYPKGPVFPAEMRADMAAAYVDEPSVEAFLKKIGYIYPQPVHGHGMSKKWSKEALDQAISKRHGLTGEVEDISELI